MTEARRVNSTSTNSAPLQDVALSQNEIESLSMKAVRGAGFSWGLAEEAGSAIGWLARAGIDGAAPLLALLSAKHAIPPEEGRPVPSPGYWRCATEAPLCPITTGAAILDHARLTDGPILLATRLEAVADPLLLLPFVARAAGICEQAVLMEWPQGRLAIAPNGSFDSEEALLLLQQPTVTLTLRPVAAVVPMRLTATQCPRIAEATIEGLNRFALQTTVPATEASRSGAGSNSPDND